MLSDEIIKVLNAIAEKFGVAVDWTAENVMPYLQKLGAKFIQYELVTSIIWLVLGAILFTVCLILLVKFIKYCLKPEAEFCLSDDESIWIIVVLACLCVLGFTMIMFQCFDIVRCAVFPERIIFEEIQNIIRTIN